MNQHPHDPVHASTALNPFQTTIYVFLQLLKSPESVFQAASLIHRVQHQFLVRRRHRVRDRRPPFVKNAA